MCGVKRWDELTEKWSNDRFRIYCINRLMLEIAIPRFLSSLFLIEYAFVVFRQDLLKLSPSTI